MQFGTTSAGLLNIARNTRNTRAAKDRKDAPREGTFSVLGSSCKFRMLSGNVMAQHNIAQGRKMQCACVIGGFVFKPCLRVLHSLGLFRPLMCTNKVSARKQPTFLDGSFRSRPAGLISDLCNSSAWWVTQRLDKSPPSTRQ